MRWTAFVTTYNSSWPGFSQFEYPSHSLPACQLVEAQCRQVSETKEGCLMQLNDEVKVWQEPLAVFEHTQGWYVNVKEENWHRLVGLPFFFKTKKAPVKALVEWLGADVCAPKCTIELVTSSQENGSTVQQLFEETKEFRVLRVSSWMVTKQAASSEGLTYLSNSGQHLNCQP